MPATCFSWFGISTKRKRDSVCNKLQPCCHCGFRWQGLSLTVSCTVILPERRLSNLCRNNVSLAGNSVLGTVSVISQTRHSFNPLFCCLFLCLCACMHFHSHILHSNTNLNVSVRDLYKILHKHFCSLYLSNPVIVV